MLPHERTKDGGISMRPYLQYLLDRGHAEHVKVKWGKSERHVIRIGGKNVNIKGVTILIRTCKRTLLHYI